MKFKLPKPMHGNRWEKTKAGGYGKGSRSTYMQQPGKSMYPRGTGKASKGYNFKTPVYK